MEHGSRTCPVAKFTAWCIHDWVLHLLKLVTGCCRNTRNLVPGGGAGGSPCSCNGRVWWQKLVFCLHGLLVLDQKSRHTHVLSDFQGHGVSARYHSSKLPTFHTWYSRLLKSQPAFAPSWDAYIWFALVTVLLCVWFVQWLSFFLVLSRVDVWHGDSLYPRRLRRAWA
jgi:hypothetical protein